MQQSPFTRDADGNVNNPPINANFEQLLYDAHQRGDQFDINEIMEEYHTWREDRIAKVEARTETDSPEVKLTAGPPNSTATVQGAPQNIVVPVEDAPTGPVAVQNAEETTGPSLETFESPMADPAFFDKLAAAIIKGQEGKQLAADEVQHETAKDPNAPQASDVTVPPAEAPPADTGNVPPAAPATGEVS